MKAMTINVKIKNGRLLIHEDQRLLIDKGGEFVDAFTLGNLIIALLKNGRVQELRTDGTFKRDIVGGGAVGISRSNDIVIVKTVNGRFDRYKNGTKILSSGKAPVKKATIKRSEAENLGEKGGEIIFGLLSSSMRFIFNKFKEKLKK